MNLLIWKKKQLIAEGNVVIIDDDVSIRFSLITNDINAMNQQNNWENCRTGFNKYQ